MTVTNFCYLNGRSTAQMSTNHRIFSATMLLILWLSTVNGIYLRENPSSDQFNNLEHLQLELLELARLKSLLSKNQVTSSATQYAYSNELYLYPNHEQDNDGYSQLYGSGAESNKEVAGPGLQHPPNSNLYKTPVPFWKQAVKRGRHLPITG